MSDTDLKTRVEELREKSSEARFKMMMADMTGDQEAFEKLRRESLALCIEWADLMRAGAPNPDGMVDGPAKDLFLSDFPAGSTVDGLLVVIAAMEAARETEED